MNGQADAVPQGSSADATWQPGARLVRLLMLAAVVSCILSSDGCAKEAPPPIPIGATERDVVVASTALARDLTMSAAGLRKREKKDDGATGWSSAFEEQIDPPVDHVVRRRFRLTIENRGEQAREFGAQIDYVVPADQTLLKSRKLTKIVVPPFMEIRLSSFTPMREERTARAEPRVWEIARTN